MPQKHDKTHFSFEWFFPKDIFFHPQFKVTSNSKLTISLINLKMHFPVDNSILYFLLVDQRKWRQDLADVERGCAPPWWASHGFIWILFWGEIKRDTLQMNMRYKGTALIYAYNLDSKIIWNIKIWSYVK